jgi:hypothetical protein
MTAEFGRTPVACKRCGAVAVVAVPRGETRIARCGACATEQPITPYELDRLAAAAAGLMRGRAEHEAKKKSGVRCTHCGASVPLPEDPAARSFACGHCRGELLVSDHVAPQVLAASELRDGLHGVMHAAAARQRRLALVVAGATLVASALFAGMLLVRR